MEVTHNTDITSRRVNHDQQRSHPTGKTRSYSFALSQDAKADLNLTGDIGEEELELLRDHIEITIKALARSAKKQEQSS